MTDLFKITPYASALTQELSHDPVKLSVISLPYLVLTTASGVIHCINIRSDEAYTLGPYHDVRSLAGHGKFLAYASGESLVVYDLDADLEYMNSHVTRLRAIALLGTQKYGNIRVFYSTETEVVEVSKGWVLMSTNKIAVDMIAISDLNCYRHILSFGHAKGVEFHDTSLSMLMASLDRKPGQLSIRWQNDKRVIVLQGSDLSVLDLCTAQAGQFSSLETRSIDYLEEKMALKLSDEVPVSVASFQQKHLVVLSKTNQLRLFDPAFEEVYALTCPIAGNLLCMKDSPLFLVGSNSISRIEPISAEEKLKGLIDVGKLAEAYDLAAKFSLPTTAIQDARLVKLLNSRSFGKAAEFAVQVCEDSVEKWVHWTGEFLRHGALEVLLPSLPYYIMPYDFLNQLVLELVKVRSSFLLDTVRKWPDAVVGSSEVLKALRQAGLYEALATVYVKIGRDQEAYDAYLALGSDRALDILEKDVDLATASLRDREIASKLLMIDTERALSLCIKLRDQLDVQALLGLIPSKSALTFLGELSDPNLNEVELDLILKESPGKLKAFLKRSKIDLEAALHKARELGLVEAQVYLLRELGQTDAAKQLLATNFDLACEYLTAEYDEGLWQSVLAQAKPSVDRTAKLLSYLQYHPRPLAIYSLLAIDNSHFPGVRDMIQDISHLVSLSVKARQAAKSELLNLRLQAVSIRLRGIACETPSVCAVCSRELEGTLRLRHCGHNTHAGCMQACRLCKELPFTM